MIAEKGVRATIEQFSEYMTKEGLNGTVDVIVASNPQADFIPEAAQLPKSGGQLIINATKNNPFGNLPDAAKLKELGLKVVKQQVELLDEFKGSEFKRSDGLPIREAAVKSTVIEKI